MGGRREMDDTERRSIVATLRRCSGQFARPIGMSYSQEQVAILGGYLKFNEWPSGHYQITDKGHSLIEDCAE